ncbi:MAG: phosphate ABC transporter permease subunit PstC [Omnitrophica WOR_2 bacterium RIFCSPLOWO2_12_FULL_51_24]|nr:MAG: phosphate ABC transporter permease subunit PstC [Omnitrophica WOR_2 bacterium RIFCSPHIGHO2_01_FULL_49_10]OGX33191.1 MAG: phosphate ABC transporter permease subunit PstC [Omnitrophica WOR_2 bacterium RIFCSPLOWO2_02_FULL_50_19]OGX42016.1 MAG: phosphate ABC transporter permease subunit PstC [Omnitrophica WOR_2 bacterium RIFCSPLOWO2_12_FULL_51_24]
MTRDKRNQRIREFFIEKTISASGIASVVIVVLIFVFLLKDGLSLFKIESIQDFLSGKLWYPISDPPKFGILPLILGSIVVTAGATAISVPIGVASAIYIAEVSSPRIKEYLKAGVELLAAIPSVVLGFIGVVTLVPFVKQFFNLPTGLTAFSGSIMLAFMAMPTIVSIAEDALTAVPRSYREGALALGATKWQTIYKVTVPSAASGIVAAVMLGVGRVIGETMAVMMITGNAAVIPKSIFQPVRTLTATIAAEMGETVRGSDHFYALFAIGIVLFLITFFINMIADLYLHREKR